MAKAIVIYSIDQGGLPSFLAEILIQYLTFVYLLLNAFVAQMVERVLGKNEVSGSIPDEGSISDVRFRMTDGGCQIDR